MNNYAFFIPLILCCCLLSTQVYSQSGFGPQQIISNTASHARDAYFGDLDGDGDLDVLSASFSDDKIAWYQNDGLGNFNIEHIISTIADGAEDVHISDLDGDGDLDVLSASKFDDKIAWYQNVGLGLFGPQQIITDTANGANSVYAIDLDGDGDNDVLSASEYDGKVAWYENDGIGNFGVPQIIDDFSITAEVIRSADIDDDGDNDVLACSSTQILWYANDGFGGFANGQIIGSENGLDFIHLSDLNGDNDLDVISASSSIFSGRVRWYANDGMGNFGSAQTISTGVVGGTSVYTADLDRDGDFDVLSADRWLDEITWYCNDGAGNFEAKQIISSLTDNASSISAADFDGDGKPDALSASVSNHKIAWYKNNINFTYKINQGNCSMEGSVLINSANDFIPFYYSLYLDSALIITDSSTARTDTVNGLNHGDYILVLSDSISLDTFSFSMNGPDFNPDYDLSIELNSNSIYSEIQTSLSIQYRNQDCTPINGEYWFLIDSNIIIDSFLIQPDSYSGDTARWLFSDLNIDSGWIYNYAYFKTIYSPIAIEEICFSTGINPVNQDINTLNNLVEFCNPVIPGISITLDNYSCTGYANLNFEFLSNMFPHTYLWVNEDSTIYGSSTSSITSHTINNLEHGIWHFNISDPSGNSVDKTFYIQPHNQPQDSLLFVDFSGYIMPGNFIPGILDNLIIPYYNLGCNASQGQLIFLPDSNITIHSAPGATYISSDTIIFPIGNISSDSPPNFYELYYSTDTNTNINGQVCLSAYFIADSMDINLGNNEKHYCWPILAPYDPNDKTVYPHGVCSENFVEKDVQLEYLIRYQNTGTAPAINVTVLDTIDAELLPNSLRLLSASYEPTFVEQINDSVVAFRMYNINLPDSGTNVNASQGYVYYTIEIDSLTNDNETIENSAAIYFDYNEPIITNTTLNTVVSDLTSVHTINYDTLNYCDSALFNGNWYYSSQVFIDTLLKSNGCDSITYTSLFISYSDFEIQTQIACDSIEVFGNWYFSSQTVYDTLSTAESCDSVIQTNIFINNSVSQYDTIISCDSAIVNGDWYYSTQIVSDTFQTVNSCDSIINTDLTIYYSTYETQADTACDSAQINDNWYYTSQLVRDTFQTVNSCDSIINTDLTIHHSTYENQHIIGCDSVELLGNWLINNTSLFDTLNTSNNCDSVIEYVVTINSSNQIYVFDTILIGETYILPSGLTVSQTDTYYDTLTTNENCDSIVITNLLVDNSLGIGNINQMENWKVYPNPTSNSFTLKLEKYNKKFFIEIINTLGQVVYRENKTELENTISTNNWSDGVYYINLKSETGEFLGTKKIVVSK